MKHVRNRIFQSPLVVVLALTLIGLSVLRIASVRDLVAEETSLRPQPELLVSVEWLAEKLGDNGIRIVDLRSASDYGSGHIPNAVHIEAGSLFAERDGVAAMLPPPAALQEVFRAAGIAEDTVVVAYDSNNGLMAARLFMALDLMGQENGRLLDGGWAAWKAAGLAVSSRIISFPRSNIVVRPRLDAVVRLDWMREHIGDSETVYVDARSSGEYQGEQSGSQRHGRIPGAVQIEWLNHISEPDGGHFKSPSELAKLYTQLGITPDKTVATYCQSHVRAAHSYFTLKWLGYPDVRAYDGSWSEWGNRTDTPIEQGPPQSQVQPSGDAEKSLAADTVSMRRTVGALEPGLRLEQARRLIGDPDEIEVQNPCWGQQTTWTFRSPVSTGTGPLRLVFLDGILKEIQR